MLLETSSYFPSIFKQLLKNINVERDVKRKRDIIKKVIAYMTLGIDVSRLFTDMIMVSHLQTLQIPHKKLVDNDVNCIILWSYLRRLSPKTWLLRKWCTFTCARTPTPSLIWQSCASTPCVGNGKLKQLITFHLFLYTCFISISIRYMYIVRTRIPR